MNYSKPFYNSKRWKQTQHAYMESQNYVCERCGGAAYIVHHQIYITPINITDMDITLNWGNLQAVCLECHNHIHYGGTDCAQGLGFDINGQLIKI